MKKKMIVVHQHDLQDCGVCCLSSVIQYYGGYVPLEKLRIDTQTSKNGTTAYNLLVALKKYGFDVRGVKSENLDGAVFPAIAHLEYDNGLKHFVVIYEITKNKVVLMDPAKGKVVMKLNEFMLKFTNVLLLFYPKTEILVLDKGKSVLRIFLELLQHNKRLFAQIITISIMFTLFSIVASYYFKVGIEAISNYSYMGTLKFIVLVFLIVTILKELFAYWRRYLENYLNKNIDVLLLSSFINHIFKIPSIHLSSRSSGEVMTRVNELANIKSLYTEIFVSVLLDFILTLAAVPILYTISSNLFFILFLVIIIYLVIGIATMKLIYEKAYRNIEKEEEFNSYLLEGIGAFSSIKNLNVTDYVITNIEKKLSSFIYDNFCLNKFLNSQYFWKNLVTELGLFAVSSVGFYLIYQGKLSIASLITFNSLMVFFLNPMKNLIEIIPKYNFLKATFNKINDFVNIEEEKLGKKKDLLGNEIIFNKVSFSYNEYNKIVVDESFVIPSNSMTMIKGKSGSGKSTICKILNKDITNYQGEILIGGKNIKDYSLATIRDDILYVSQNENLFNDTIINNLLLNREVEDQRIEDIAKICCLNEIIDKKVLRYESRISNNLDALSGGEKQRVILARALLKESKIIMLDEALSEVDYQTERRIINNIKRYFNDKTIIYITHKKQDDLFDQIINLRSVKK